MHYRISCIRAILEADGQILLWNPVAKAANASTGQWKVAKRNAHLLGLIVLRICIMIELPA